MLVAVGLDRRPLPVRLRQAPARRRGLGIVQGDDYASMLEQLSNGGQVGIQIVPPGFTTGPVNPNDPVAQAIAAHTVYVTAPSSWFPWGSSPATAGPNVPATSTSTGTSFSDWLAANKTVVYVVAGVVAFMALRGR